MSKSGDGKKGGAFGCGVLLLIGFLLFLFLYPSTNVPVPRSAVEFAARYHPDLAGSIGEQDGVFALPGNAVHNDGDRKSGNVSVQLIASDNADPEGNAEAVGTPLAKIDFGVVVPFGYGPVEPRVTNLVDPWMSKVTKQLHVALFEDGEFKGRIGLGTYEIDPERWVRASQRPHCVGVVLGVVILALAESLAVMFYRHGRWGGWLEFLVWIPILLLATLIVPVLGRYCLLASFAVAGTGNFAQVLWLLCLAVGTGLLYAGGSLIASAREQGWLPAKYVGIVIQACVTAVGIIAVLSFHHATAAPTRKVYNADGRSLLLSPSLPESTSPESE